MKRILVISTTGMGDSLWGTPAIRALKKSFPGARLDLLLDTRWEPLFRNNPHLDRIFAFDRHWYRQLQWGPALWRSGEYDEILVFHANRNLSWIRRWARGRSLWAHQIFPAVPAERSLEFSPPVHGIERRLRLIEKIGARPDGGTMEIFFDAESTAAARRFMEECRLAPGNFIYMHVGASAARKRWPTGRFTGLARSLLETTAYPIVLGCGPDEHELAEMIASSHAGGRIAVARGLGLQALAHLIGQARLMISSDTGPMHIGFALKTPTVALFGVSDPQLCGPFQLGEKRCFMVQSAASLETRWLRVQEPVDYFHEISLDMVRAKVRDALGLP